MPNNEQQPTIGSIWTLSATIDESPILGVIVHDSPLQIAPLFSNGDISSPDDLRLSSDPWFLNGDRWLAARSAITIAESRLENYVDTLSDDVISAIQAFRAGGSTQLPTGRPHLTALGDPAAKARTSWLEQIRHQAGPSLGYQFSMAVTKIRRTVDQGLEYLTNLAQDTFQPLLGATSFGLASGRLRSAQNDTAENASWYPLPAGPYQIHVIAHASDHDWVIRLASTADDLKVFHGTQQIPLSNIESKVWQGSVTGTTCSLSIHASGSHGDITLPLLLEGPENQDDEVPLESTTEAPLKKDVTQNHPTESHTMTTTPIQAVNQALDACTATFSESTAQTLDAFAKQRTALADVATSLASLIRGQMPTDKRIAELDNIAKGLASQHMKVGLFGMSAAGKSTLTNALIAEPNLLKMGSGRTTRVISRILPTDAANGRPSKLTELRYKQRQTIEREIRELLSDIGISTDEISAADQAKLENIEQRGHLSEEDIEELNREYQSENAVPALDLDDPAWIAWLDGCIASIPKGNFEAQEAAEVLNSYRSGWKICRERLGTVQTFEPEDFTKANALCHEGESKIAVYIEERIIYHDNRLTQHNVEMIDAPGVGICEEDTNRAYQIAQQVDAFLVICRLSKLMANEKEFLRSIGKLNQADHQGNLLFALNQIDQIDPSQLGCKTFEEAVEECEGRLSDDILKCGVTKPIVLSVSGRSGGAARLLQLNPDDSEAKQRLHRQGCGLFDPDATSQLAGSRLVEFEDAILEFATKRCLNGSIATRIQSIRDAVANYSDTLTNTVEKLTVGREKAEQQHQRTQNDLKAIKTSLDDYLNYRLPGEIKKLKKETAKERVNELANTFYKSFEKIFRINFKKSKSMKKIINKTLKEVTEHVYNLAEQERDHLIRDYKKIRQDAHNHDIPDRLNNGNYHDAQKRWKSFAELETSNQKESRWWDLQQKANQLQELNGGSWLQHEELSQWKAESLNYLDQPIISQKRLEGLSGLKLGFFQGLSAAWEKLVANILDFLGLSDENPVDVYIKAISKHMQDNYNETIKDGLLNDIFQWIEKDAESFTLATKIDAYYIVVSLKHEEDEAMNVFNKSEEDLSAEVERLKAFNKASQEILARLDKLANR